MEERTLAARRRLVRAMETTVADRRRRADVLDRLRRALTRRIEGASANVAGVAGRLEALSPLSTLARGYAIPLGEGGKVMKSTRQFVPGAPFRLRVTDGAVGCRVESILEESEE